MICWHPESRSPCPGFPFAIVHNGINGIIAGPLLAPDTFNTSGGFPCGDLCLRLQLVGEVASNGRRVTQ
jgi:hypothetical protein